MNNNNSTVIDSTATDTGIGIPTPIWDRSDPRWQELADWLEANNKTLPADREPNTMADLTPNERGAWHRMHVIGLNNGIGYLREMPRGGDFWDGTSGGPLVHATSGGSDVDLDFYQDDFGVVFTFEIGREWTINFTDADKEIADLRSIVDQFEAAIAAFRRDGTVIAASAEVQS